MNNKAYDFTFFKPCFRNICNITVNRSSYHKLKRKEILVTVAVFKSEVN